MKGNMVAITGNVTRDADVRRTQGGGIVVSWGVCWNSSRKNQQGGYDDVPNYFDVQAWVTDGQLNVIEGQLVKGARCSITEGHLVYQSWEKYGQKRSKVLVQVDDPIGGMTVRPPRGQRDSAPEPEIDASSSVYDDDIPF